VKAYPAGREPAGPVALAGPASGRNAPRDDGAGNAPAVRPLQGSKVVSEQELAEPLI
jgi:hypothetical protein